MTWKGANDRKIRKYDFGYDPVSRLIGAKFGQYTGSSFSKTLVNYDVTGLSYDGNGNILAMNQYGLKPTGSSGVIDQLSYRYITGSNKLLNVVDAANDPNSTLGDFKYTPVTKTATTVDYAYDGNGNMISDKNKKITGISYNILNLPSVITVAGKGTIRYYYDATGNKLRKRTIDNTVSPGKTTVTTYIGGAVYQNDTLQFFGTPEGRVRANTANTAWIYDYFLKDHLGNTRMMITDDYNVASPILEAYSYYPFGLQQKGIGLTASGTLHNYKNTFQKQEFNEDLGVDLYEFKYRMDDPQIGRFWQIDPLADDYTYNSPYAFSEDKVTSFVELEGLEIAIPTPFGPLPLPIFFPGSNSSQSGSISVPSRKQGMQNVSNNLKRLGNAIAEFAHNFSDGISGNTTSYTQPFQLDYSNPDIVILPPQPAKLNAEQTKGGDKKDNTYDRVKLRKGTKEKINENQPKNAKGENIDPNTGKVLDPDNTDIGHKTGNEWRRRQKMHQQKGSTRQKVIEEENNSDLYQLEDRHENRSHKHEEKSN